MKAVITAGGRVGGTYARDAGTVVKALAPVRGATMLDRIIDALRDAGVDRIAVVGGPEVRAACAHRVERIVDETPSGSQNLLRALKAWPDDGETLLYATSDLPYVTAGAIDDFAHRVPRGSVAIGLAEHAAFCARFPGSPPFGISLAGVRVVNGGVFALSPGSLRGVERVATALFDARKQPWQMARLVGPAALLRFALRRLSVTDIERIAVKALGVPAIAVRGCDPELTFDADTAEEYTYACSRA